MTDQATASVTVINPKIKITKTANSQYIVVGSNAIFTITVTNNGDSPLSNITLSDAPCTNALPPIGTLAAGASSALISCTVPAAATGTLTNTVNVSGTSQAGTTVTDQASASEIVINPSIKITKTAGSQFVLLNGTVTFTLTVTNTGDSPLSNVAVSDAQCTNAIAPIGNLASGASSGPIACSVPANTTGPLTNTASTSGTSQAGTTVSDQASATVTVINPSIKIAKTADSAYVAGLISTFTITVTNTGDSLPFERLGERRAVFERNRTDRIARRGCIQRPDLVLRRVTGSSRTTRAPPAPLRPVAR